MPLEDAQVIDVVRQTDDGKIVVVITDSGTIKDPAERVACLIQKLKAYINSIASGDLKRDYPEKTAKDFLIEVECRHRPTPEMLGITQVMPRKDPANTVPVRFLELAKGSWGPQKAEKRIIVEVTAEKKSGVIDERLDELSNAALAKGAEVSEHYLAEDEKGFYFAVLGWDENKSEVVYFREDSVTNAVMREVDQYVRDLTLAFTICVLVSVGNLRKYKRGDREAVLLVLHRRGHQMARVYAMPVKRKGVLHKHNIAGSMELVGSKTGLFPF